MDQREWVDRMFRAHAKELYRYLRTFRLPEEDTYDLVQDSFFKLLDVDPSRITQPKIWLFTIGRNLAINERKRTRRRAENHDVEDVADASPGALSNMLEDEKLAMLWQAFSQLSPRDREIMHLNLEHELSYRQIAKVLGKSEISVRVAMHRGRNRLRRLFQTMDGEGKEEQGKGDCSDPTERSGAKASAASETSPDPCR